MFESIADLMRWKDADTPISNHPTLLATWLDGIEAEIDFTMVHNEATPAEHESVAAAKEIGLGLIQKFLAKARSVWGSHPPADRLALAEAVLQSPQVPQRTPAWYLQSKSVLTASEFSTLYGTPRAWGQMVMSKVPSAAAATSTNRLACMTCEMGPFDWGVRFEPVVKQVLAQRGGAVIVDSGRIMHPTDSNLAASPDGFIMDATDPARIGRLIEIKCPIRRVIGEGIPFEYWCQMQIQMEVTGVGECEYVEVKFDSIEKESTDLSGEKEGCFWLMQNPATCEMRYVYTIQERAGLEESWELVETIPWRVAGLYTEVVVRDRNWFASTAGLRERFWADVARAREGGFEVPAGRKKLAVTVTKTDYQIVD